MGGGPSAAERARERQLQEQEAAEQKKRQREQELFNEASRRKREDKRRVKGRASTILSDKGSAAGALGLDTELSRPTLIGG